MTTQEAYDKMRAYYTRPDTSLGRSYGICEYITDKMDETQRCAVGCLLPMPLLEEIGLELNAVGDLREIVRATATGDDSYAEEAKRAVEALGLSHDDRLYTFLKAAQQVHDNHAAYKTKAEVVVGLDELAASYGLTVPS